MATALRLCRRCGSAHAAYEHCRDIIETSCVERPWPNWTWLGLLLCFLSTCVAVGGLLWLVLWILSALTGG